LRAAAIRRCCIHPRANVNDSRQDYSIFATIC
jgi:hypothetical protein